MKAHPPKFWTSLFRRFCQDDFFEELQGDLEEKFYEHVERFGVRKARNLYRAEVIRMIRPSVLRTPKLVVNLSQLSLFQIHLKLAFRNLLRNKVFSAVNITSLAAAITLCLFAVNMIYTGYRYDRHHDRAEDIYRVTTKSESPRGVMSFASSSYALTRHLRNIPQIEETTFFLTNMNSSFEVKGQTMNLRGYSVDDHFLNIFDFEVIAGNPRDIFNDISSIAITDKAAKRLFGEESAVGKLSNSGAVIRAVIKSPENDSHLGFDFLHNIAFMTSSISPKEIKARFDRWDNYQNDYYNYFRLREHANIADVEEQLESLNTLMNERLEDSKEYTMDLQAITDIMFGELYIIDMLQVHSETTLWVLTSLIIILIALASFNYTNLSVARALQRSKEIGIRKIVGSNRRQIIGQFITETCIFSFSALLIGLFAYQLLVPRFNGYIDEFAALFNPHLDMSLLICFAVFSLLVGLLAGIFPALHFSRISPLKAIQHKLKNRVVSLPNIKKILVGSQLCVSTIGILFIVLINDQKQQLLGADLGVETEGLITLPMRRVDPLLLKAELNKLPEVEAYSITSMIPATGGLRRRTIISADHQDSISARYGLADAQFMKVYEPEIQLGHGFTEGLNNELLVDEYFLEKMSIPLDSAIGASLYILHYDLQDLVQIVGVLKDYSYSGLSSFRFPIAIRNQYDSTMSNMMNLKLRTDNVPDALQKVEAAWKTIAPDQEFSPVFVDQAVEKNYSEFFNMMYIIELGGIVIILIAVLGQFGVALFNAQSRIKEIGIRKVLGASYGSLARLFSRNTLLTLVVTAAIAIPVVNYFFQNAVIPAFSVKLTISAMKIALGLALIWGAVIGIVMLQTLQTARTNPAETLRND